VVRSAFSQPLWVPVLGSLLGLGADSAMVPPTLHHRRDVGGRNAESSRHHPAGALTLISSTPAALAGGGCRGARLALFNVGRRLSFHRPDVAMFRTQERG